MRNTLIKKKKLLLSHLLSQISSSFSSLFFSFQRSVISENQHIPTNNTFRCIFRAILRIVKEQGKRSNEVASIPRVTVVTMAFVGSSVKKAS